jgi:hypothetical protein
MREMTHSLNGETLHKSEKKVEVRIILEWITDKYIVRKRGERYSI